MIQHIPNGLYERYIKRPLDFFLSFVAIIILFPIFSVTAVLIRKKLGAPIVFTQERPGKDEKIFKLYKFRTMTNEKDENGNYLPDAMRLTSFGKKLRTTSLDELPELFNILKGDMAIVGPRPLLVKYLPYYKKNEKARHSVRPGLTGPAQVNGRNNLDWDRRLMMDIQYVNSISFVGDLKIILKTFVKVLKHEDVVSAGSFSMNDLDVERRNNGNQGDNPF